MVISEKPVMEEITDWMPGDPENTDAPELEDILALFDKQKAYYEDFHRQCETEEEYYMGNRTVPAPEGIDAVWPATAGSIVNTASDHVDVNNLAIDVPSSPRSRARAERIQKTLTGIWLMMKKPVLRTAVRQSFLYGVGWIKSMWDSDNWPNAPVEDDFEDEADYKSALNDFMEKRSIKFPFAANVINPRNLVWDDSKTRTKWVIEFMERDVDDVGQKYPEWKPENPSASQAEWFEYWDEDWVMYVCDRQIVWGPHRHGYGHLPYTAILPVHSYTFEDGSPEERYRGVLNSVHNLLDEEARLMTQVGALVRTVAYRTIDFYGPEQNAERVRSDYELFGGKNIVLPGVDVRPSPMVQIPPDIIQQLSMIQTKIEEATFPNVIRGVRPTGVSSGFGLSVLAGMGRLVFQGVADGLRHALEDINKKWLMLIENKAGGRVTVYGRNEIHNFDQTIGPDQIRGYHENTVRVKAEAPEEREREALLAMRLKGAGIISLYEAQRRAGITDPMEEQMQIRAEQLLNTPEFIQQQTALLLQKVGLPTQMEQTASPTGETGNVGSRNIGGAQLARPGEANIQAARVASQQGRPSVYPQGMGGIDQLGAELGGPTGGAVGMPSGETIGE
jgi:hypothetical protein